MKNHLILLLLIALAASGCRSSKTAVTEVAPSTPPPATEEMQEHVWDFRDATTWILGDFSLARLLEPPHSTWYLEGFANYNGRTDTDGYH